MNDNIRRPSIHARTVLAKRIEKVTHLPLLWSVSFAAGAPSFCCESRFVKRDKYEISDTNLYVLRKGYKRGILFINDDVIVKILQVRNGGMHKLRRPTSPCMHGGELCERHAVGCKSDCAEWKEFERKVAAYRSITNEAKGRDADVLHFQTEVIRNVKKKSQKK